LIFLFSCDFTPNPLGTCECEREFFISDNCQQAYYCSPSRDIDDIEPGCLMICSDDEYVFLDVATDTWECRPKPADFVCPGLFHSDCGDKYPNNVDNIDCHCAGEIWMKAGCREVNILPNISFNYTVIDN